MDGVCKGWEFREGARGRVPATWSQTNYAYQSWCFFVCDFDYEPWRARAQAVRAPPPPSIPWYEYWYSYDGSGIQYSHAFQ